MSKNINKKGIEFTSRVVIIGFGNSYRIFVNSDDLTMNNGEIMD